MISEINDVILNRGGIACKHPDGIPATAGIVYEIIPDNNARFQKTRTAVKLNHPNSTTTRDPADVILYNQHI